MAYLEKILFLFLEFSIVKVQLSLKAISRLISKLKSPRYLGPDEEPEAQKKAYPVLGSLPGWPGFAQRTTPQHPKVLKGLVNRYFTVILRAKSREESAGRFGEDQGKRLGVGCCGQS